MEINEEVTEILKEFKINKSEGLLCLLGIYFKLDVEKVCSEDTVKAINLTKIVEKNYTNGLIKWNVPLFKGQQTEWDWVKDGYNKLWDRNQDRKDSSTACIKRMQEWFKKYPHYRKEDVQKATMAYHASVKDPQYLKRSASFIFEGQGGTKISQLLGWVEKSKDASSISNMKGTIMK